MSRMVSIVAAILLSVLSSYLVFAQSNPRQEMSFFVTSVGLGDGGNLGGLAGADRHCQMLAQAAGSPATRTWHAYLSTQGPGAVNARDRIGKGPWKNSDGADLGSVSNVAELHGETGQGSSMNRTVALGEKGRLASSRDILTGSQPNGTAFTDGADHTCNNWTSNAMGMGAAQVGHEDRASPGGGGGGGGAIGGGGRGGPQDIGNQSWNSSHQTKGCSQSDFASTGGEGLLYCFAIN